MSESIKILNTDNGPPKDGNSPTLSAEESLNLSKDIQKLIKKLKGEYTHGDAVNYSGLKESELYKTFLENVNKLDQINLESYTENQRKAFFINAYNTLTIHGVISQNELPESVLKVKQFWRTTAYRIGGHVFSLDDIEHGILRANSSHPASTQPNFFAEGDFRLKYCLKTLDPRIHFALNCGARSCPVVTSYSADNLDTALDVATKLFCNQEIIVLPKNEEVCVSKIFEWYESDFGRNDIAALRWTLQYLEPEQEAQLGILLQSIESVGVGKIIYNEYDWNLNSL